MRLSVECGGFTQAADACRTANQVAALLTESLSSRLADCAGMAGNDATSSEFARAYDAGSREAVAALADLTHSFIGVGRLLAVTGLNHASAELASAGLTVSAYVGDSLDDDAFVRIRPSSPPSSIGTQEPSLSRVDAWILDQIEGFVWPGADVASVRSAASAWRRAAASVGGLVGHVEAADDLLAGQRSPEVPIAISALGELSTLIGDTAWQLESLATACEEYAASVEEVHERTRALLAEIGQMAVEGVALSVLVTGVTGGLGGGAAAGLALARIRAYAPRFHALLVALRAGTATAAARLRTAREELIAVRVRAEKFVRVPARTERGEMRHPLGWLPNWRPGWLAAHEKPPGHTIGDHVGKSVGELAERLGRGGLRRASTFDDARSAEQLVHVLLSRHADEIAEWRAAGGSAKLVIESDLGRRTGTTVMADGTRAHPTGVRAVLIPQADGDGWQLLTAFPN